VKKAPKTLDCYVPLREVARRLGKPWTRATRMWLFRLLRGHEQRTGFRVLFRMGNGGGAYYTTWPMLEHAFPELFPRRNALAELLRQELESYELRLGVLARKVDDLGRAFAAHVRAQP
jgi:hypothetical protein